MINIFEIIKKLFVMPAEKNKTLEALSKNLRGKMFIFESEKGNPFASSYKLVLDDRNGWIQWTYVFRNTGLSTSSPESTQKTEFLKYNIEIDIAPF